MGEGMKPILFNTEMVRAIIDGRKTVTRRTIKLDLGLADTDKNDNNFLMIPDEYGEYHHAKDLCKYQPGDILYVRETWKEYEKRIGEGSSTHIIDFIAYKADENNADNPSEFYEGGWKPSIHMPKELARIFLKVTDVRVERLSSMLEIDFINEGIESYKPDGRTEKREIEIEYEFEDLWNSTIKKQDLNKFGWDANPWVWVIEFEKLR